MPSARRALTDYAVIRGPCFSQRVAPAHTAAPCCVEGGADCAEVILHADVRIMHVGVYTDSPPVPVVLCAEPHCPTDGDIYAEYGLSPCAPDISPALLRTSLTPIFTVEF